MRLRVPAARQFLMELEFNRRLQRALENAAWNPEAAVAIASDEGYFFSVEDLEVALDEIYGEMREQEMRCLVA